MPTEFKPKCVRGKNCDFSAALNSGKSANVEFPLFRVVDN